MEQVLKSYLEHTVGAGNVFENVPLSKKTTMQVGGNARFYVEVHTKEQLMRLMSALRYIEYPYFIIGFGANVLAADEGYNGVVIRLAFKEIIDNQCFVYADAGASIRSVCSFAAARALGGLEWAVGIPGTVGGCVFMNAGAHGSEMAHVVAMADVLTPDGGIKTIDSKHLKFAHRKSVFHRRTDWVILGAYFHLEKTETAAVIKKQEEYLQKRKSTQPSEPSAGSVFVRPSPDVIPAKMIDELGFKGKTVGGAKVSEKHAGFIVNTGSAAARDVLLLIKQIKREVYKKYRVRLTQEIRMLSDSAGKTKTKNQNQPK